MKGRSLRNFVVGIVLFVLVLGGVIVVLASSPPANGCLSGDSNGWAPLGSGSSYATDGVNGCGRIKTPYWGNGYRGFLSSTFYANSTSVLSYSARTSGSNGARVYLVNYETGSESLVSSPALSTTWQVFTATVYGSGQRVGLHVEEVSGDTANYADWSDFFVSDSADVTAQSGRWLNGAFPNSKDWFSYSVWAWDAFGHNGSGSMKGGDSTTPLWSMPFYPDYGDSTYTIWHYGTGSNLIVTAVKMDGSLSRVQLVNASTVGGVWNSVGLDLSAYVGNVLVLEIYKNGYIDDVCPNIAGCSGSIYLTPTPSPTAGAPTSTPNYFPYGQGTAVPVIATIVFPTFDWSGYPTAPAIYGLGTPAPVYFQSPQAVYWGSPQMVGITGTVVVKVDDSTPVRVRVAPDTSVTPLSGSPGELGAPVVGSAVATRWNTGSGGDFESSTMPNWGSGSPMSRNLVELDVRRSTGSFCLPGISSLIPGSFCYDVTIDYLYGVYVWGEDISGMLAALGGALIFYGLVRQVQK